MPNLLDKAIAVDSTSEYFKGMIYGERGCRKTTWASSAPKPLWLDFERSTDTLRYIGKGHIPMIKPASMEEVLAIAKELARMKHDYETVVLDTATRMQLYGMNEFMKKAIKANTNKDQYLPTWGDYRRQGNLMDEIFMELHDLPMNVIILAHDKKFFDEDTGNLKMTLPDLTPRVRDAVSGLLNMVAYVELKHEGVGKDRKLEFIMHFTSGSRFYAKNRMNLQEPKINPDFNQVYQPRGNSNAH